MYTLHVHVRVDQVDYTSLKIIKPDIVTNLRVSGSTKVVRTC